MLPVLIQTNFFGGHYPTIAGIKVSNTIARDYIKNNPEAFRLARKAKKSGDNGVIFGLWAAVHTLGTFNRYLDGDLNETKVITNLGIFAVGCAATFSYRVNIRKPSQFLMLASSHLLATTTAAKQRWLFHP